MFKLKFGSSAMIIKDDFKVVTSDLSDELSFALNGDPMNRGKVRSLIEPIKTYRPKKMEIWVFKGYHEIMHEASFSSLEQAELEDGLGDKLPLDSDNDQMPSEGGSEIRAAVRNQSNQLQ